jgi:hypothetical protein
MGIWTAVALALVLILALWVPYFFWEIRRGKARGHTWFTSRKARGHSDIGPDVGFQQTRPGTDEARGARY